MPILQARHEAEALCAWLNSEGHVDACITADSDAFLYGAKCVVKCLQPNSKVSFSMCLDVKIEYAGRLDKLSVVALGMPHNWKWHYMGYCLSVFPTQNIKC